METGPAVPTYILRGHEAPIHTLHFYNANSWLASGDSDGWLVIWSLSSKRPVAVWKAHDSGIMQIQHWKGRGLVSHGRDHKLRVWQVRPEDFAGLSTELPTEANGPATDQAQPWLLHSLAMNALNFCSFSMSDASIQPATAEDAVPQLIASPNGLDSGGIDIFHLPSERRISQIRSDQASPTGMVMAVSLFHQKHDSLARLVLISGYEDGRVIVHMHEGGLGESLEAGAWQKLTSSKAHSQPILSLEALPSRTHFLTSSADATIAKFSLPALLESDVQETAPEKARNTKHASQQGLSIRSDGKIFATAGWDGRVRVYSCKTVKELAVLKWHKVGVYSTAFARVDLVSEGKSASSSGSLPSSATNEIAKSTNALDMIKQAREEKARQTHWLAAGGKDGKISLWDIY